MLFKIGWEKSADMGMFIRAQKKARMVLVCLRGRYQDCREKAKRQTDVEKSEKRKWTLKVFVGKGCELQGLSNPCH